MQKVDVIRPLLKGKTLDPRINGTDCPGTYRWWFHERCLKDLGITNRGSYVLMTETINGERYYALYFGIAVKETIRERFIWHILQSHSKSNIKHGTISTLRHTLSALLLANKNIKTIPYSERIVNDFINDNCMVEWTPYTPGTESQIHIDELNELSQSYWYPLNIQCNKKKDTDKLSYYKNLKKLRRLVKMDLLNSI